MCYSRWQWRLVLRLGTSQCLYHVTQVALVLLVHGYKLLPEISEFSTNVIPYQCTRTRIQIHTCVSLFSTSFVYLSYFFVSLHSMRTERCHFPRYVTARLQHPASRKSIIPSLESGQDCAPSESLRGSVLQCAAVCCSVLQCVAECCSVLHCATLPSLGSGQDSEPSESS